MTKKNSVKMEDTYPKVFAIQSCMMESSKTYYFPFIFHTKLLICIDVLIGIIVAFILVVWSTKLDSKI